MRKISKRLVAFALMAAFSLQCVGCFGKTGGTVVSDPGDVINEEVASTHDESKTAFDTLASDNVIEGNIIDNYDFSSDDVSMWLVESGASEITACSDATDLPEGYTTYGRIDRNPDTSRSYDCFAQNVTSSLVSGVTYDYEFYAKLSDDYKNVPDVERVVEFAPYLTVEGSTTYLGFHSNEIKGVARQVLKVGEWTKFYGTFTPVFDGKLEKGVIRIIEQGTDFGQGDCVKGDYYITGLKLIPQEAITQVADNAPGVEKDIPDLCSVVASEDGLGKDAICGNCLGVFESSDSMLMELVEKHFNAITIQNELKMDAILGYSNDTVQPSSIHEEELNGEPIEVPTLFFSRADKLLDKIIDINERHPDRPIKVRGHVLVWHSQAPEWFFHVGYDKKNDYVTAEEMDRRMEWYIKTVLEYYTGEDSKYKDLFYGWDVVNEAVSDATGTYRTDMENGADQLTDSTHGNKSSWWKVYQTEDFIINAFRYANKYAPADLKLYYNDYNECDNKKRAGIIELLKAVKAADGTRIDGFGMQAHYTVNSPAVLQIEKSIREYAEVVDEVMITEMDVKASPIFDGSDEMIEEEYKRQAAYYGSIYDMLKVLKHTEGINISGITIWGEIDTYSWLQSRNNVGGGSDGNMLQCPLLFDGNYKAKPAYWAFVNPEIVDTSILSIDRPEMSIHKGTPVIDGELDEVWSKADIIEPQIRLGTNVKAAARFLWDEEKLYVYVEVEDDVLNEDSDAEYMQDSVEIFIDEDHARSISYEDDDKQYRINYTNKQSFNGFRCGDYNVQSVAFTTDKGYIIEASFKWTDITPQAEDKIGIDIQINDASSEGTRKGTLNWADNTGTGYNDPEVFGHGILVD